MGAIPKVAQKIHRRYDMKGSVRHRRAKPDDSIGKDLNFWDDVGKLEITRDVAQELAEIHEGDTELLLRHDIMDDYSLLLFIHDRDGSVSQRTMSVAHVSVNSESLNEAAGPDAQWLQRTRS